MNIAMVTNSYLPNINGVARSVEAFQRGYRRSGHNVLVVAPAYDRADPESNVIRIPSLQRFNGSDFSVAVPVPSGLFDALEEFEPDIIHSHHPFLLGDTALRAASRLEIGLVFTHHTHYEQYTQYVPGDSPGMKRFIVKLSTGYANLADLVIAPSESTARLLRSRGVERPISVVPTGVESDSLRRGNGGAMRAILGIPGDAFVIGHLGRLSAEKNLDFLSAALVETLRAEPDVHFLLGGAGECRRLFESRFGEAGLADRLHLTGSVQGAFLASAYKAMDVFAFTSQSETQGMVLVEAMACGIPVLAIDAPGAREVVRDQHNGRLLFRPSVSEFAAALRWFIGLGPAELQRLGNAAYETAAGFSIENSTRQMVRLYQEVIDAEEQQRSESESPLGEIMARIRAEWDLLVNLGSAAGAAIRPDQDRTTD